MKAVLQESLNRDLVEAAFAGDLADVCRALGAGAEITCAVSGIHGGAIHGAIESRSIEIVQVLLDRGCPVDHLASSGHSPLSVALHELADTEADSEAVHALAGVIDLLLRTGPRAVQCSDRDQLPLALARDYGFTELEARIEALHEVRDE